MNSMGTGAAAAALVLALTTGVAHADGEPVFQESGGLLVVEIESASPSGNWASETSIAGYTGSSYTRWNGPNLFSTPGTDTFGVSFDVHQPGAYSFRIRNRHDHPDSTEANDVWVRMDGGAWVKVFSGTGGTWTWSTYHEFSEHDKPPASYELGAGRHRIEFSGRSYDFMMDRFHLFLPGHPDGQNPGAPESASEGVNRRPVPVIRVSPPSIPEDDGYSTVVTLDARDSWDPDGDSNLAFEWGIRGARFVGGTSRTSAVARILLSGERAMPVRLVVRDGADPGLSGRAWSVVDVDGPADTRGEPVAWHPLELAFRGPLATETDVAPNPFLDYRLVVTFRGPSDQEYRVHGFFDGDGEGGGAGDVWKARFSADEGGLWRWEASFRTGELVAINPGVHAGAASHFDGATGEVYVFPRDEASEGFLAQGRLEYVDEHYLKFRDGGYFIKGGTDSPENFMGYRGFDAIHDNGGLGIVHEYPGHVADWLPGDPLFTSATTGYTSKGIIGALNYLSSRHVNSIYFLPMNLGGDGQETSPFVGQSGSSFDNTHYDVSRMHQWNEVFDHAQRKGILLHFVLAETESNNENWLDNGSLGVQRKLFYRELAARFGHNLAIKWNLSEENDFPVSKLIEFASYIDSVDPYGHPISVHTHPNNFEDYTSLLGNSLFSSTSIQYDPNVAGNHVKTWRTNSRNAGHKWILDMDENNPYNIGLTDTNADDLRKRVLYDVYFSGGQVEWYAGYHALPLGGDLQLENFRTREAMWDYMWFARRFMQDQLPFHRMEDADELLTGESTDYGGAEVFAEPGVVYAVYYPRAEQTGQLDLRGAPGELIVRWFNPRLGHFHGGPRTITGGSVWEVEPAPNQPSLDWVLLVESRRR